MYLSVQCRLDRVLLAVQVFIKASRADEILKGGSRDPHNFGNRCLRHLLIQKRLDLHFLYHRALIDPVSLLGG
jgi:hypothetical protein